MKDPTNVKLKGVVSTIFKGTTLRGLLLEAYAFSRPSSPAWASGTPAGLLLRRS
jgi:hypothetical protein